MLTKKHFKKIADILNQSLYQEGFGNKEDTTTFLIMENFIGWLKSENPKFDEVKFREAVLK